jgi:outer membrane protein assembly factor BamA
MALNNRVAQLRLSRVLVVVLALAAAAAVRGEEVAGVERAKVVELRLVGVPETLHDTLLPGLALAPRGGFFARKRAALTPRALDEDRQRILLFLARNGFPDAVVVPETAPAADDGGVVVTFTVTPGDPITYGPVVLAGFPPPQQAAAEERANKALPGGDPFDDAAVTGLRADLIALLESAAYPSPAVDVAVTRISPGVAAIAITAAPGVPGSFSAVRVRNVPADIEPLAQRVIDLTPGTPYSPEFLDRTSQALRDLNIFRRVELKPVEIGPGDLLLEANLLIRPMATARASVGSWTDDWIRVTAGWAHRNLFGRARGLELGAAYSPHLIESTSRFWWPALLTPRSRADLTFHYKIEDEDSYRLESRGGSLTNLFSIDSRTSLRVGMEITRGDLDNRSADPEAFIDDVGLQTIFAGRWFRDTADDALVPSRGSRLGFEASVSVPGVLTDNPFGRLRATESRYLPLRGKRLVAAARLDVGYAWPLGDASDLTPQQRFFAGGVSTMRGYHRRELGPHDVAGQPIGGEAMVLAGAELRQQLVGMFGIAAFVDVGQVWRRTDDVDLTQMAYAAGGGLMVTTPVGPVRLDVAYNLTAPLPGEPRTVVQLGIGHPY